VDFVVDGLPVEVKFGKKEDLAGITKFMAKFRARRGIIVTKETLERKTIDVGGEKHEVLLVPLWLFLLSF